MNTFMRLLCLLPLFFPLSASATAQGPDRLIWKGDTLALYGSPFKAHPDFAQLRAKLFGTQQAPFNTGCWRGYIAEWELQNDTLYLANLYTCDYPGNKTKADLESLFPSQLKNGKLPATWVNAELLVAKGEPLVYVLESPIYEKEIRLKVNKGVVIQTQTFDNSKTKLSIYTERTRNLLAFIDQNIRWDTLPSLQGREVRVFAAIISGASEKPDSIQLIKGAEEEVFTAEALRILHSIPAWSCYYKGGQVYRTKFMVAVIFNEAKRKAYRR